MTDEHSAAAAEAFKAVRILRAVSDGVGEWREVEVSEGVADSVVLSLLNDELGMSAVVIRAGGSQVIEVRGTDIYTAIKIDEGKAIQVPKGAKYYRTLFEVEVLSDTQSVVQYDLADLDQATDTGGCVGCLAVKDQQVLSAQQMADAAVRLGSEPEFFSIHVDGDNKVLSEGWTGEDEESDDADHSEGE